MFMEDIKEKVTDEINSRSPEGASRDGEPPVVVAWEDFDDFLKTVGDDAGFKLTVKREPRDDITRRGNKALMRILRGKETGPPFIVMLQRTLGLLYEAKGITVEWSPSQGS